MVQTVPITVLITVLMDNVTPVMVTAQRDVVSITGEVVHTVNMVRINVSPL